jgi:hypothetical protein
MVARNQSSDAAALPNLSATNSAEQAPSNLPSAWEMIAPGRYRPRRIRGSCLGRELG